jgi:hypothetical protein
MFGFLEMSFGNCNFACNHGYNKYNIHIALQKCESRFLKPTRMNQPTTFTKFLAVMTLGVTGAQGQNYGQINALEVASHVEPGKITLTWPARSTEFTQYSLQRKAVGQSTVTTTLPNTATGYVDTAVVPGVVYDYKITGTFVQTNNYKATGAILSGIQVPVVEPSGEVLLVVADTVVGGLATELANLKADLRAEGWLISEATVSPTDTVASVKTKITDRYTASGAKLKSVFLIGRVPVPYSGNLNPDAHPEHKGAWPCDGYYGDLQSNLWTDTVVNTSNPTTNPTAPARAANVNVPGDSKFDQSIFPSRVELAVGRIDFSNLPAFAPLTELDLLRRYLNRNHQFRCGQLGISQRAVITDGLASLAEGVGAAVRRMGAQLPGGTVSADFLSHGTPSLIGGAFGFGSYSSISGVGSTADFASKSVNTVCNQLFGSYFGDWDTTDNVLRASIAASGVSLVSVWSARPVYAFTNLQMGQSVGELVQNTMNQGADSYLQTGFSVKGTHIALMGDPTLKLRPVAKVSNLQASLNGTEATISWNAGTAASIQGYYVYCAEPGEAWTKLTPSPISTLSYTDMAGTASKRYLVRTVKLESTSGTYLNLGIGAETGITLAANVDPITAWKNAFFGSGAPASVTADDADPDKDGSNNLLEYAMGTIPTNGNSCHKMENVRLTRVNNIPRLSADFTYDTSRTGVIVSYQCSSNLTTWLPVSNVVNTNTNGTYQTVTVSTAAGGSRCFLRALVRRN